MHVDPLAVKQHLGKAAAAPCDIQSAPGGSALEKEDCVRAAEVADGEARPRKAGTQHLAADAVMVFQPIHRTRYKRRQFGKDAEHAVAERGQPHGINRAVERDAHLRAAFAARKQSARRRLRRRDAALTLAAVGQNQPHRRVCVCRRADEQQPLAADAAPRGTVGIPRALNMYEDYPFWFTFFTKLGWRVVLSDPSTKKTYEAGIESMPSESVCYPAKLSHGHIMNLLDKHPDFIWFPCSKWERQEDDTAGNHFNCPIVAYYAELLNGNMEELKNVNFLYPYVSIDSPSELSKTIYDTILKLDPKVSKSEVLKAAKSGFAAYKEYKNKVKNEGAKAIAYARENGKRIMILAGRPYHIDPEIGHGIDKLATSLGFVVVSEDSVCELAPVQYVKVLDQWTFHSRLYRAARYATEHSDTELVQLVSFGCGVDAITTDEVRSILEEKHKHYTQIKIDEITNLGAVKIRLRSLIGALEEGEAK